MSDERNIVDISQMSEESLKDLTNNKGDENE